MSFLGKLFGKRIEAATSLTKFCYSYSGNKAGTTHDETVVPVDETHSRISISHTASHDQDPKVEEFLVDIGIMEELKAIFVKYSMNKWHKTLWRFISQGQMDQNNRREDLLTPDD